MSLTRLLDEIRVASRIKNHTLRHKRIDDLVYRAYHDTEDFWYCWIHDDRDGCGENKCDLGHWEPRVQGHYPDCPVSLGASVDCAPVGECGRRRAARQARSAE